MQIKKNKKGQNWEHPVLVDWNFLFNTNYELGSSSFIKLLKLHANRKYC